MRLQLLVYSVALCTLSNHWLVPKEKEPSFFAIDKALTKETVKPSATQDKTSSDISELEKNREAVTWKMEGTGKNAKLVPHANESYIKKTARNRPLPKETNPPKQETKDEPKRIAPPRRIQDDNRLIAEATNQAIRPQEDTILINFNNVNMVEFIRFVSRITGKNFVFNEADLNFTVTIVSERPTSLQNVMTALLQELRIRGFNMLERGNNLIIHPNPEIRGISKVIAVGVIDEDEEAQIVTRVFSLNTVGANNVAAVIRPLTSPQALVDVLQDSNHLIVTDLSENVREIEKLVQSVDSPQSGMTIGRYFVEQAVIDPLISTTNQLMIPIAGGNPFTLVPDSAAGTIYVVSTPFLVEKSLAVMQQIDLGEGESGTLDFEKLRYREPTRVTTTPIEERDPASSNWFIDENGNRVFRPTLGIDDVIDSITPPRGQWLVDENGEWYFQPGESSVGPAPRGQWVLDENGVWVFVIAPDEPLAPSRVQRRPGARAGLPVGTVDTIRFSLYKLQYRSGDQIANALQQIAASLRLNYGARAEAWSTALQGTPFSFIHEELVAAIESVNWIESSNTLVFTGTESAIERIQELIREIDVPLRQVFVEMLILETTIDNSLNFGVDFAARGGGSNFRTAESSIQTDSSPIVGFLDLLDNTGNLDPTSLQQLQGFNMGIIGQCLRVGGLRFGTISALVNAVHRRADTNVIMNPKIICEDNVTAEIFVGINTRFQTQAVSNDEGSIITNNFEFRDVGTTLKVTPHLGTNQIVTLEIEQEVSRETAGDLADEGGGGGGGTSGSISNVSPGPTTRKNMTKTRFHVPNRYFLIISGMIEDEKNGSTNQVPCLGGIPFLGAGFKNQRTDVAKRNLMIFIRPEIIDTEEEVNELTRRQQNIWEYKKKTKDPWKLEVQEALKFFNVDDMDLQYKDCPATGKPSPDYY